MGDGTASPIAGGGKYWNCFHWQRPPGTPKIFLLEIDKQKNFRSLQNSPKKLLTLGKCIDSASIL